MAISDIINKITDEANKKAAFMKQVTDDEIKKIEKESAEKAEERKKEIEIVVEKKCQSVIKKAKILAKMESNSSLLKEKREVIDAVYAELEKEFNNLGDSEYTDLLIKMFKSATASMPEGELIVPENRRKQTEDAIGKSGVDYHIKEETNDFKGGFVVRSKKAEVNLSFPYLVSKMVRPKTELEVAGILFK